MAVLPQILEDTPDVMFEQASTPSLGDAEPPRRHG